MATAIMARKTGTYRCSGVGQTIFVQAGEELPAHDTCPAGCEWEFRPEDNPRPGKATVIIGNGPFYVLIIDEVPQVGDIINLGAGLVGSYCVTAVNTITRRSNLWPNIMVKRKGDHEERLPIHRVGRVALLGDPKRKS